MSDLDKTDQSNQPSSILTVNTLWFLSIVSSLAATTWAILCLEWCAFLSEGSPAEDYEEMAEKRQLKFEAVERWKMRLIVAAIPLFLHTSLFLFLAGLWLRLRDINKQLGLIVGVSSLTVASSYVIVTLLPIFTNAPFSSSASELVAAVVWGISRLFKLRLRVRRPLVFTWIANLLPAHIPSPRPQQFSALAGDAYKTVRQYTHAAWKTVASLPILPTFAFERDPFNELNKLEVGRLERDKRIHLRALYWLMNTPLGKDEVKEILKEFKNLGAGAGEPLDRTILRLLVSSISSILDNNDISEDEQPIFDHCTAVLAEGMERAFEEGEHNPRNLFRNAAVFEKLSPHFHLTSSAEDAPRWCSTMSQHDDYWSRAIPALWLCPTKYTVSDVVNRLNFTIRSVEARHLQRIIRGLHAAILVSSDSNQSTFETIPDFSLWDWNHYSPGLDKALTSFLQDLLAAFFSTHPRTGAPTTTPSLIIDCLTVLDRQPEQCNHELHAALCFFAVVKWRSDPQAVGGGPLLARALLTSAENYHDHDGDESHRAQILSTRLRAIAYGPQPSISKQSCSLKCLGDLFTGLPESTKTDVGFLKNLLDAYAAILETTLGADGHLTIFNWIRSPDRAATRDLFKNPLFANDSVPDFLREDPNSRLPYLYSLAIALTYTTEGRNQDLWKVAKLLVTRGEQERITTVDRALDTNIIVVAILKFAIVGQAEAIEDGRKEEFIKLLAETVMHGNNWRTHWKSIYLAAGIAFLLSQMNPQNGVPPQARFLIESAEQNFEQVKFQQVPSDWERKKKGLALCELDSKVRSLVSKLDESKDGVYDSWSSRETVPYLALYHPCQPTPEPISHAAYWAVNKFQLQRYVLFQSEDDLRSLTTRLQTRHPRRTSWGTWRGFLVNIQNTGIH